jgi:hypothetical protein
MLKKLLIFTILIFWVFFCGKKEIDFEQIQSENLTKIHTDLTYLKDANGRYMHLRGVNVSGTTKVPVKTDPVSYVGRPFPLEKADYWFSVLSDLGFNSIRLLIQWEAIEPNKKGEYDKEYLDYVEAVVKKANEHHIYVLLDMHQDIFSRHLNTRYTANPWYKDAQGNVIYPEPGSIESLLLSVVPDSSGKYTDMVSGDGFPKWAVQACLPEKKMDSPTWGIFRPLLAMDAETILKLGEILQQFLPQGGPAPQWIDEFTERLLALQTSLSKEILETDKYPELKKEYESIFTNKEKWKLSKYSSDMMPFTNWGVNGAISVDNERAWACFFAGNQIFRDKITVDGMKVQDYLQEAYRNAWLQIVERVRDYPNVLGYDIINEPVGFFITLTAAAAFFQSGTIDSVAGLLKSLLGEDKGKQMYELLLMLNILPPDSSDEKKEAWGLKDADLMALLDLNIGFDAKYFKPFIEYVGNAILEKDPDAVLFMELTMGLDLLLSTDVGYMEINITKPEKFKQAVFAPHWYPDIYPFFGFNMKPRDFIPEEWRYRDFTEQLQKSIDKSSYSLGNIPVVFGEFGTYFNFQFDECMNNGYIGCKYDVSAEILDNYYENFEKLFQSNMIWCFSADNDYVKGDLWNHEDFSIIGPGPDHKPRAEKAYSRPYPRSLPGKPVSMHFNSDYHYYDPDKGKVDPVHEFELKFRSKETDAPAEIFIPEVQYPDGFFVWISDGYAVYDPGHHILYFYPADDDPDAIHWIRILPPLNENPNKDFGYFFKGNYVINGK